MKLTMNTVKLQEMVMKAVKGAGNNKLVPITNFMCISGKGGKLTLITTDSTNYLYVVQKEAYTGDEDFYVTVQVEQFSKLLTRITSPNTTLEVKGETLEVIGNGKYTIGLRPDESGQLIKYPDPYDKFYGQVSPEYTETISLADIKVVLNSVKPSLALTMEDPILTNYYVGEKVLAADGYKIASYNHPVFNNPALFSSELMNLLDVMTDNKIQVAVGDGNMLFFTDSCVVFTYQVEDVGEYPAVNINGLIDGETGFKCTINKSDFLALLDRLSLFVSPYDNGTVTMVFSDKDVLIKNKSDNSAEAIDYVSSENCQPYICMVSIDYLLTQIKSCVADNIEMYYGNESSIKVVDGDVTKIIALSTVE